MKFLISEMTGRKIAKSDFDAFDELAGGKFVRNPFNNSAKLVREYDIAPGVTVHLICTVLLKTDLGTFYGRNEDYNIVRIDDFSTFGKGCRSSEIDAKIVELLSIL